MTIIGVTRFSHIEGCRYDYEVTLQGKKGVARVRKWCIPQTAQNDSSVCYLMSIELNGKDELINRVANKWQEVKGVLKGLD